MPGPPPPDRRQRFVISRRRRDCADPRLRADMVDLFAAKLDRAIRPNVDLVAELGGVVPRRVAVVDADPEELAAKRAELTADALIEPERARVPMALGALLRFAQMPRGEAPPGSPGLGGTLSLSVRGPDGEPVEGAVVVSTFLERRDASAVAAAGSRSDGAGRVDIPFDSDSWVPVAASVTPRALH